MSYNPTSFDVDITIYNPTSFDSILMLVSSINRSLFQPLGMLVR